MAIIEGLQRYLGLIAATAFVLAVAGFGAALPGYLQGSHPVALLGAAGVPHALGFNLLAFVLVGGLGMGFTLAEVGRIIDAQEFPEARKPAYKLKVDFGSEIGVLQSSAQITEHYTPESLIDRRVVGVVNVPPKQIGPLRSQCLITGFHDADGAVRLCVPDGDIAPGTRLR